MAEKESTRELNKTISIINIIIYLVIILINYRKSRVALAIQELYLSILIVVREIRVKAFFL